MSNKIEAVLTEITKALSATDIVWAVGASVLLHQYGLVENPTDIDITIKPSDTAEVDAILSAMGIKQPPRESDIYLTHFFAEYVIDGVHVDVMAGLKIKNSGVIFDYAFDEESVPHHISINDIFVPFATIEEWYVLYQLIPDRENKVQLIARYLEENRVSYPHLIKRMLSNPNLSDNIRHKIEKLI